MKLKGHTDNVKTVILSGDGTEVRKFHFISFHFQFLGMVAPKLEKTDLQGAMQ